METKGIVLKTLRLGNGLRAIFLYTELLGRVNAIAKVRRGEFPIKFEPFSVARFKLLQKGERFEVQGAKLIKENFPKTPALLQYRARVVKPLIGMEVPGSKKLFKLIESYLSIEEDLEVAYPMFLSKLLFIEGLYPQLRRCVACSSREIAAFSVKRGGVLCPRCGEGEELAWSKEHSKELVKLTKEPFRKVKESSRRELLPQITRALEGHLKERID